MKKFLLTLASLMVCLGCSSSDEATTPPPTDPAPPTENVEFYKGADVGWLTEMEHNGYKFYDTKGTETECLSLLKTYGINAVRLRVWVDPKAHGNYCNADDVLKKALRAKALGMDIMINFHYSDWWADPSKQNIPAAWKGHSYEQMKSDVASHTTSVLELLKQNGISPKWVQVGNETSNGFLWDMGKASTNMKQYAGLTTAGYDAVKSVFPEAIVIVHLDNGFDQALYDWIFDGLKANGGKWDMIGMSLYPYWATTGDNPKEPSAEKTITDCIANIKHVSQKYGCDVMIVETGMESDKPKIGKEQLARIIREAKANTNGRCKGVFYWEPQCRPKASQYKLGAFTDQGVPTEIMDAFKEN